MAGWRQSSPSSVGSSREIAEGAGGREVGLGPRLLGQGMGSCSSSLGTGAPQSPQPLPPPARSGPGPKREARVV